MATKGLLCLNLDGRCPRGFSTSILMKGNQEASQPRNLNCGDQGASLPWSWWKVTKGLLYLGTWDDWKASLSQSWTMATKGLLYLDLDGRCPRGLSTSEPGLVQPRGFSTSEPRLWHWSWRFVHGDLFFEDLFMEIFPLNICSRRFVLWRFGHGDFSFKDLFTEICPLKIFS